MSATQNALLLADRTKIGQLNRGLILTDATVCDRHEILAQMPRGLPAAGEGVPTRLIGEKFFS